jgi:hypothetical protein
MFGYARKTTKGEADARAEKTAAYPTHGERNRCAMFLRLLDRLRQRNEKQAGRQQADLLALRSSKGIGLTLVRGNLPEHDIERSFDGRSYRFNSHCKRDRRAYDRHHHGASGARERHRRRPLLCLSWNGCSL